MLKTFRTIALGMAIFGGIQALEPVQACPMCKVALENDQDPVMAARPKAYMYSILFMLSMPATLTTLFGVSFYRLSKRQQALNDSLLSGSDGIRDEADDPLSM